MTIKIIFDKFKNHYLLALFFASLTFLIYYSFAQKNYEHLNHFVSLAESFQQLKVDIPYNSFLILRRSSQSASNLLVYSELQSFQQSSTNISFKALSKVIFTKSATRRTLRGDCLWFFKNAFMIFI